MAKKCGICRQDFKDSDGYCSVIFGSFHHQCMNRAEDFVRAMAKMNQCTTDHFLNVQGGTPSMSTQDEKMARYVKGTFPQLFAVRRHSSSGRVEAGFPNPPRRFDMYGKKTVRMYLSRRICFSEVMAMEIRARAERGFRPVEDEIRYLLTLGMVKEDEIVSNGQMVTSDAQRSLFAPTRVQ